MYEVHVSKKGHNFKLTEICCEKSAEEIAARWRDLGYEAKVEISF